MRSNKYDEKYFRETRADVGVLLTKMRPLWRRWIKIIRKYKPSGKLLDAGCGEGYFLEYAEKYYEAYGIDASEYCIKEAKQRANHTKLSVGSITHLDYDNEYFDVVTCFDVLEHLDNPSTAIRESCRVLKSGGVFVIRVPNTHSIGIKLKKDEWFGYRDKTHVTFYDGLWDPPYFKKVPKVLQHLFFKIPSMILFVFGFGSSKLFGENLCVITERGAK